MNSRQICNVFTISQKQINDEVDFLHVDKHLSFVQVNFNTLGIKVSYKVILSLLMDMIRHSQSTQSNKFLIFLQYIEQTSFLHADKQQSS